MNTRLIYGTIVVLLVTVLALVIALAVVASNKSDGTGGTAGSGGSESQEQSGGNTDDSWDLPVVDCSYGATNLDKAKCVLDSYPLVDG